MRVPITIDIAEAMHTKVSYPIKSAQQATCSGIIMQNGTKNTAPHKSWRKMF